MFSLAPGDVLKLSSPENESLLVLVNSIINESDVFECFPVALDTFISTQSSIILEPKDSTLETDLAVLLDYKFLVNKNHPIVEGLIKLKSASIIIGTGEDSPNKELTKDIALHLYDMAKLSIGGLEPESIADFQSRNADLLGKLIRKAI